MNDSNQTSSGQREPSHIWFEEGQKQKHPALSAAISIFFLREQEDTKFPLYKNIKRVFWGLNYTLSLKPTVIVSTFYQVERKRNFFLAGLYDPLSLSWKTNVGTCFSRPKFPLIFSSLMVLLVSIILPNNRLYGKFISSQQIKHEILPLIFLFNIKHI